jgi:caffeoyl-CoA O-methyltransferase
MKILWVRAAVASIFSLSLLVRPARSQERSVNPDLDARVENFLAEHRNQWVDMNVPESDGKALYDLIVKHHYRKALEIGTSTGRSAIWIAWALSKTGGKLITVEIDGERYREALAHFEKCGLSGFIDARLADAHRFIPRLEGPFDFVFCDADKDWYKNYFLAVSDKIEPGGCYAAHNVRPSGRNRDGTADFLKYVESLPDFKTSIDNSGGGISISIRKPAP